MIDVLLFVLFLPTILVWAVFKLIGDIGRVFGFWIAPGALLIYVGIALFVVGPPAQDAAFESAFQWLSGYVVVGLRLPLLLLVAGAAMLVAAAAFRAARRGHTADSL